MSKKKIIEKDMYPYARKALRNRFLKKDGWEIYPQDNRGNGSYIPDFTVEKIEKKLTYRIPVEVKLDCKIMQVHIDQLNRYARGQSGVMLESIKKFLFIALVRIQA